MMTGRIKNPANFAVTLTSLSMGIGFFTQRCAAGTVEGRTLASGRMAFLQREETVQSPKEITEGGHNRPGRLS
ncbi:MAG: hypothetical protein WC637_07495 [Victivallales bacterium]